MVQNRQSVFDQILGNIGKTASNVVSGVANTISPTIHNVADHFIKDYQNQVQQNQIQAKQNQQQIADFTNSFIKTTQKVAQPVADYFNPLKAKPDNSLFSTLLPQSNNWNSVAGNADNLFKLAKGPVGQEVMKIGKDAWNSNKISTSIPSGQIQSLPALYKLATNPGGAAEDMQNTLKSVQQDSPKLVSLNKTTGRLEPNILENQKALIKAVGLATGPGKTLTMGALNVPFVGIQNMIEGKAPWAQDYQKSIAEGIDFGSLLGPVSEFAGGVLNPFLKFIKPDYLPKLSEMILAHNEAIDPAVKAATRLGIAEVFTRNILEAATKGFAGMGAVGAMEPADSIQQRINNLINFGLQGAAFEAGGKAIGLGVEGLMNRKAGIIPDISTPSSEVPTPPINPIGPSNQANLKQPQTPADIIQADMQKTLGLNQPSTPPVGGPDYKINPTTNIAVVTTDPVLSPKADIVTTDIYGNKITIPTGERVTPYVLEGNKVLLEGNKDNYIVSNNQYTNIKNQSIQDTAKPFAPELEQTTETILGDKTPKTPQEFDQLARLTYDQTWAESTARERQIMLADAKGANTAKYNRLDLVLPGGDNYKEIIIQSPQGIATTLPKGTTVEPSGNNMGYYKAHFPSDGPDGVIPNGLGYEFPATSIAEATTRALQHYNEMSIDFLSSHYPGVINPLSHIRLDTRTTLDGKPVTFLEEIQSDWAGAARKANAEMQNGAGTGAAISTNPLLKNWQELSIKRALIEAVNNNSEYLSWTNGEQQKARYNLSKQVDMVLWSENSAGRKQVQINPKGSPAMLVDIGNSGQIIHSTGPKEWIGKTLDEVVGKGIADKINQTTKGTLSGEGLNVGGEWTNNLYDKQIKNIVEDVTGGKVETLDMGLSIDKTPQDISWNVGDSSQRYNGPNHLDMAKYKDLKVGDTVSQGPGKYAEYVVTDILGDGKFKAVSKDVFGALQVEQLSNGQFRISAPLKQIERHDAKPDPFAYFNRNHETQTFDISTPKSAGQQAIKITPEIRAKILGEKPPVGQTPQFKTIPSGPDNHNINIEDAKKIIDNIFTPEEIQFKTNGEKNIMTPDGKLADGVYYKSLITVVEQGGKVDSKTVYHEAFHAYADKFVNPDLYGAALYDVMSKEGISKQAASEKLADSFADYASGKQTFTGQVLAFFQDFINKFRTLIGKDNSAQQIYDSILNKDRLNNGGVSSDISQFKVGGKGEITPSDKWQEYNPDQAMPIGGEFKTENGKQYVRFPKDIAKQNEKVIQQDQGQAQAVPVVNPETAAPAVTPSAPITNPQDPFYNINRIGGTNEARQFAKDTITSPEIKAKIEKATGGVLTHKKVVALGEISKPLDALKTNTATEKLSGEANALRNKVAELSSMGLNSEQYQEALVKDYAFGRFLARLFGQRRISSSPEAPTLLSDIIGRILKEGHDPEKVLEAAKKVNFYNKDEVTRFYREFVHSNFGDWSDKVRYNSMLSGINTHIINMASNWQGSLVVTPLVKVTNGIVDSIIHTVTGKERTQFAGEGIVYTKAASKMAGAKIKEDVVKPWNNLLGALTGKNVPTTPSDIGSVGSVKYSDSSPKMRWIDITTPGDKLHPLEVALDIPGKALEKADQFFIAVTKAGLEAGYKYRENKGVKVKDISGKSATEAENILFRGDLNRSGEGYLASGLLRGAQLIQRATYSNHSGIRWMSKMSFPFVRVATNLAVEGVKSNPVLGAVNMIGNANKTEAVSKMILGGISTIVATGLALSGNLHAAEPTDPVKKAAFRKAGYQPWSIDFMGQNIQFNKMHPVFAMQLGLIAAVNQGLKDNTLSEDAGAKVMAMFTNALQYTTDQTYVKTLQDFGSWIAGDPQAFTRMLSNYPSQFIPYKAFGSWITRIIDNTQRKADTSSVVNGIFQNIIATIPGASFTVPPRTDQYGNPLINKNNLFNAVSAYNTRPLDQTGMKDYQDLLQKAEGDKLLKMQQDKSTEAKAKLDTRSPAMKEDSARMKVQNEIAKNNIKLGAQKAAINGSIYMYWDDNTQETKTIDLSKFNTKQGGISAFKQQEDKYAVAKQIHDAPLTDAEKNDAYKQLGTNAEEVRYDYISSQTQEVKTNYLISKFTNQPKDFILERLVTGRVNSVSGKQFATNGVVDNLVDEGIITVAEGKAIKNIKFNKSGALLKSSGSGKKVNFSFSSLKTPSIKRAQFKLIGPPSGQSASSLPRIKRINTKAPSFSGAGGSRFNINSSSRFNIGNVSPKLRTPVIRLSGLGRIG